jgi:hypothetical protein
MNGLAGVSKQLRLIARIAVPLPAMPFISDCRMQARRRKIQLKFRQA